MPESQWKYLEKISCDLYRLKADEDPRISSQTFHRVNFCKLAFDDTDERLIATDTRGYVYLIELRSSDAITYKKYNNIEGTATSLAFNPLHQSEIIVGLSTNDVAVYKLNKIFLTSTVQLRGHNYPVTQLSFHKHFCLGASSKEAIIWDLRACVKLSQLRLACSESTLKKSAFSSCGQIALLYSSDSLQYWQAQNFDQETRVSLGDFGLRAVRDFVFTKDARAIILCAVRGGVLVLDTTYFQQIASFDVPGKLSVARKLAIVTQPLDAGACRILAIHCADGGLRFLDLAIGKIANTKEEIWRGIKKFATSTQGRWIACVEVEGRLILRRIDGFFKNKFTDSSKRFKEERLVDNKKTLILARKHKAHKATQHLQSVEKDVKEELKLCRLLPILREFREYPEKHRSIIWRTILKLPMNRDACAGLSEKKITQEASVRNMLKDYTLKDRTKASLLATTLDRLVRWCPLLGQCQFLPGLVFPFLTVFQKNPLLALEASITVISNFCQKWFEYHPLPPLNILGIIENVLLESDSSLLACFRERGITSTDYAWPLLKTALSEVLSADDWLILWDHLLSYQRPAQLLMCVVAYNMCCRETIMSLLHEPEDFQRFYATQGNVSIYELLKVTQRLDENTSEGIHPDRYIRNNFVSLPNKGPYPLFLSNEYPKFLTEQEFGFMQLPALKEEEKILCEYREKAMKMAEEKRLLNEKENLVKEVQRNRMIELRKCYDEQLRRTRFNVENARDEIERCASIVGESDTRIREFSQEIMRGISGTVEDISRSSKSNVRSSRSRSSSCKELRDQVESLESEIQRFIGDSRRKISGEIT